MKKKGSFGHSATAHFLFKLIAPVMESPLRRKFFDPVKALKAAGIRSGQEVLEVGCGTGFFTVPAAELVGDEGLVRAIDLHPLAIEQVTRKIRDAGVTNVRLTKTNAAETGLPGDSIDLVLLFGVIPSPTLPLDRLLPEMHRLLKPDGALAVWTAFPWWSPASLTRGGLFAYVGKERGVYNFRKETSD
jgi:ubiquinone/menaquinone biosynthesis C-methylase UbiE